MKRQNIILSCIMTMLMIASCRENIDFEYDSATQHCVIEGYVTDKGMEVTVGSSQQMNDTAKTSPIKDAVVTITDSEGNSYNLLHKTDGIYLPQQMVAGKPGIKYSVTVLTGGTDYTSYSTMQQTADIDTLWFCWEDVMGNNTLTLRFMFQDIKDEDNYYCYRMYRNGKTYRWGLLTDMGYKNQQMEKYLTCLSQKQMEEKDDDYYSRWLEEGDSITLKLQTIDRRTYDYLFSLNIGNSNHANPIENFSNGAFGYFTACGVSEKGIKLKVPTLPQ